MSELYNYESEEIVGICINMNKEELEYDDYIYRVLLATIKNENNTFYMYPTWRHILNTLHLEPEYCKKQTHVYDDVFITSDMNWDILKEIIELEVEHCNKVYSNSTFNNNYIKEVFDKLSEDIAAGILEERYKAEVKHEADTAE